MLITEYLIPKNMYATEGSLKVCREERPEFINRRGRPRLLLTRDCDVGEKCRTCNSIRQIALLLRISLCIEFRTGTGNKSGTLGRWSYF
jgi:hypothetical protein